MVSTELNSPGDPADDRETITLNEEGAGEMSFRMVPTKVKFQPAATVHNQQFPRSFLIK